MLTDIIKTLCLVFIFVIILIYWKLCKKKNIINTLLMIFSVIICLTVFSFRIEYLFLEFESPENAFKNSEYKGRIFKKLDTENSTLLVYYNDSIESCILLDKTDSKWKIPITKTYYQTKVLADGTFLSVYKEKDNNNYYIIVTLNLNSKVIADSRNSVFEPYYASEFEKNTDYFSNYITFIENMDEKYYIKIDDRIYYIYDEFDF